MKVIVIIDETCFFHPNFLAKLIARLPHKIVHVSIVRKKPTKNNVQKYLFKNFYYFKFSEFIKLISKMLFFSIKDKLFGPKAGADFYSVASVCKFHSIDHSFIDYSINNPEHLKKIRSHEPDVIISSTSLIFDKELLKIPKKCCINRHSSLLPSYRGTFPIFHAIRCGEKEVGVSIHTMEPTIDAGIILSQIKVPVAPQDTLADIYQQCYDKGVDAILMALEKIAKEDYTSVLTTSQPSYYSFPNKMQWNEFRKRGGRFIF